MGFINHGLRPRYSQWMVVTPSESRLDDGSQRCKRRAIPRIETQGVFGTARVSVNGIVPLQVTADCLRIRIEENLMRIESMSLVRRVRSVNAISIQLTGLRIGQIAVPDLIGDR